MHVHIIIKIESTFNLLGKGLHIELHNHLLPNAELLLLLLLLLLSSSHLNKIPAKQRTYSNFDIWEIKRKRIKEEMNIAKL